MEGLNSGLSVKDRMKMFQKQAEDPKPKAEISTGVSIKDRQANFANKPSPVNQFVPSSSSGPARTSIQPSNPPKSANSSNPFDLASPSNAPQPSSVSTVSYSQPEVAPTTGLSVKERMALLQQSNKTTQDKKEPIFVPSSQKSAPFNPTPVKPIEKEEPRPEPGLVNRLSASFAPTSQVGKTMTSPSELVSKSDNSEKPQISTGMSVKERLAALQQSSKSNNERPSLNGFVPTGPSIADRINSVQESKVQAPIHRAKTEDVHLSDVKGITSKFEHQPANEPPKHATSISTGRSGGLDNEFKKKMEGMVFMPPPPGGIPIRNKEREVEERPSISKNELAELDKPIRKRAAATFDDDFEF